MGLFICEPKWHFRPKFLLGILSYYFSGLPENADASNNWRTSTIRKWKRLTTLVAIPELHSANLFNFYVQGFFHFRVHRMGFRENRNRVQKLHSRPNWRKIFFFLSLKSHHYSACSFSFFTVPLFNCSTLNQKWLCTYLKTKETNYRVRLDQFLLWFHSFP